MLISYIYPFFIVFPLKQWLCVSRGTAAVLHLSMSCIVFPVSRFMHLAFARLALPKKMPKICTIILMNSRSFHLICALTLIIASGRIYNVYIISYNFIFFFSCAHPVPHSQRLQFFKSLQLQIYRSELGLARAGKKVQL